MRTDTGTPVGKLGAAVKRHLIAGASKGKAPAKASYAVTGGEGDYLNGPRPVAAPMPGSTRPTPQPAPRPKRPRRPKPHRAAGVEYPP